MSVETARPAVYSPNFRDLGGLQLGGGRRIRRELVYRSEAPSGLNKQQLATLTRAGIRLVCDLRSDDERSRVPSTWSDCDGLAILANRLGPGPAAGSLSQVIDELDDGAGDAVRDHMLEQYRSLPAALADILRSLLDAVLAEEVPALLHCAAGKDRTGFACAVLLTALGAPSSAIEEDYLRSNEHVNAARIRGIVCEHTGRRISWGTAAAMTCQSEYLDAAMASAAARHGSLDEYLERDLGLTPARLMQLRRVLTER